jgi:hypothetical protein
MHCGMSNHHTVEYVYARQFQCMISFVNIVACNAPPCALILGLHGGSPSRCRCRILWCAALVDL